MRKLFISALVVLLAGCSSNPQTQAVVDTGVELAVKVAAREVISRGITSQDQVQKAQRIRAIATSALNVASGELVTIELVQAAVASDLDKLNLTPAERASANDFVAAVATLIDAQFEGGSFGSGVGGFSPQEKLVTARKYLEWIVEATAFIDQVPVQ